MHQVSLETICPLKAFQLHYCPDNDAKSIVKHLIFLHKFTVLCIFIILNSITTDRPTNRPTNQGTDKDSDRSVNQSGVNGMMQ